MNNILEFKRNYFDKLMPLNDVVSSITSKRSVISIILILVLMLYFSYKNISDDKDQYLIQLSNISKEIEISHKGREIAAVSSEKVMGSTTQEFSEIEFLRQRVQQIDFQNCNIPILKANLIYLMKGLMSEKVTVRIAAHEFAYQLLKKRVNQNSNDDWLRLKIVDEFFKIYKNIKSEKISVLSQESIELQYLSQI